ATIPTNTQLITVTAKAGTAVRSAEIAQHTAESLVEAVADISPLDANSRPVMVGNVVAPAMVPDGRTSPQLVLSLVLGLVAGLVVGVGLAILRKALDVKLHSSRDVAALTKYPVIATVPRDPSLVNDPVVMMTAPASVTGERYRQLRTNLRFFSIDSDRSRTFAVTSSIEGEGKTVTAINVAYALAEGGDRVLLIDADLRRPRVADYLGLEGSVGLTSILVDHVPLFDVVQQLGRNSPDVLTAGTTPANPAGLIGSRRMQQLLEQVAGEYKTIVVDAAPVLPVADTLALLPFITGTVVVAAADKVTVPQLRGALDVIERTGTQIVGITLNKERRQRGNNSYYGYGYEERDQTRRSKRGGGRRSA
ncbi:MAG: polysaccharide biosynthesis tyrosine autokinase, partial [Propionibacteriaceae bacterium]|nr:polysaccharide biosynthesis tyrosine autokinase [Propionibacteriaceae bacterium]